MEDKKYGIIITDYYNYVLTEEDFKFEDFAQSNYSQFLFDERADAFQHIDDMLNDYKTEHKDEYDLLIKQTGKNTIKLYRKDKEGEEEREFNDNDLMTIFNVVEFTQK